MDQIALLRLSLMIVAISVRVFDYIIEKNCPDRSKYYRGNDTYAGRLKSLTYITMVRTITIIHDSHTCIEESQRITLCFFSLSSSHIISGLM